MRNTNPHPITDQWNPSLPGRGPRKLYVLTITCENIIRNLRNTGLTLRSGVGKFFYVNGQLANISVFVGQMVSAATAQDSHYSMKAMKAATDNV